MSKQYQLTVSIVLYNTDQKEITDLLDILDNSNLNCKVYLVDNSPNPLAQLVYTGYGNVEYIFTGRNLGFGAGHNVAIAKAVEISEFHLILNADVHFKPGILTEMYNYMKDNSEVGMMGPKIYNPDGSLQFSAKLLPTPFNLLVRRFIPLKGVKEKMDAQFELKNFSFDRIIEVPFLLGCFLLINTNVFKLVPGFDERYFMYMEDVDLTRRIQQHYKTYYFPLVSIYHEHSRGSYENRKLLKYHMNSVIKYFNKWGWFIDRERERINAQTLKQI